MDDDDADYMQGSDDEVCFGTPSLSFVNDVLRTTASITLMVMKQTNLVAQMLRICTTKPNVRVVCLIRCSMIS
jgi:hypothetical protein